MCFVVSSFFMPYTFLGKTISGGFTLPSGVVMTDARIIRKIAHELPEIGVITTKSIGPTPRAGHREPIFTQYAPGCFMNAVGLTNPGMEDFARQLEELNLPTDRFLLISIFGQDVTEYVTVAEHLAPYADGFELNLSCPNVAGHGMAIGQDPQLVREITAAVKQAVRVPVIPKLTPNVPSIVTIAQAAVEGGADALCAVNTVGPGYYTVDGHPVLTNVYGGMSGKGILPIGLKGVKEIAAALNVPIIGGGGVSSANDVRAYRQAGASIVSVGSAAVAGLSSAELRTYFQALQRDLDQQTNGAETLLKPVDMQFRPYRIIQNHRLTDDLNVIECDREIAIKPGQFIFVWIPGVGEKPFSVLDHQPLTLLIQQRGCVTRKICQISAGETVYVRGPYGVPVQIPDQTTPILVCGGCGLAAVYQIAREVKGATVLVGAKRADYLFYLDQARQVADVHVATEDGSVGFRGLVTELLAYELAHHPGKQVLSFFNCGPEGMIHAATKLEAQYTAPERIFNAIDYVTKCGVGVCGSCVTNDGRRLCVDGPFIPE